MSFPNPFHPNDPKYRAYERICRERRFTMLLTKDELRDVIDDIWIIADDEWLIRRQSIIESLREQIHNEYVDTIADLEIQVNLLAAKEPEPSRRWWRFWQ